MKTKQSMIFLSTLALVFVWNSPSFAQELFVNAATGNDTTGNGTSGNPYATMQRAMEDGRSTTVSNVSPDSDTLLDAAIAYVDASVGGTAWLVVGDSTIFPNGSIDGPINDILVANGYTVTLVTDSLLGTGVFGVAEADALDLILVSESVGSGDFVAGGVTVLLNTTTPLIHMDPDFLDTLNEVASDDDVESTAGDTQINIANAAHALAGGLSAGLHTVYESPYRIGFANASALPPSVTVVATVDNDPSRPTIYTIDAGGALQTGTASSRRVFLGMYWGGEGGGFAPGFTTETTIKVAGGAYTGRLSPVTNSILSGGWSSDFSSRDVSANETILDGASTTTNLIHSDYDLANDGTEVPQTGLNYAHSFAIDGLTITNGRTVAGPYDQGANIRLDTIAFLTLRNCKITDGNSVADDGGGIMAQGNSSFACEDCTFSGNTASDDGYVIFTSAQGIHTFERCVFENNGPGDDGVMRINDNRAEVTVENCIFSGNTNNDYILRWTQGRVFDVINCTFFNNTMTTNSSFIDNNLNDADDDDNIAGGVDMRIINNIFMNNDNGGTDPAFSAQTAIANHILTATNNLFFGNTFNGSITDAATPNTSDTGSIVGNDPTFTDSAGGDFTLLAGSPAINAGIDASVLDDFRGFARIDGSPDLGAYEFGALPPGPPVVVLDVEQWSLYD